MPPQIPSSLSKILPRRERSAFGSLDVYPEHVSFNSQDPGESIYILMRSHIAVNIGWVVRFAIGVVFPFILITMFEIFNMLLTSREIPPIAYNDLMPF